MFLLLGFQFHSLTLPLLIFLTQPISLASAMFALWITDTPLNVSSFMGGILLIGLDVKNGIILIEYIGQLAQTGSAAGGSAGSRRADSIPADRDDQFDDDLRPGAPGVRTWPRRTNAATVGNRRDRRADCQHAVYATFNSGWLLGIETQICSASERSRHAIVGRNLNNAECHVRRMHDASHRLRQFGVRKRNQSKMNCK